MTARQVFIVPFESDLLPRLSGREVIVRSSRPEEVVPISEMATRVKVKLEAVLLEAGTAVARLPFQDRWRSTPLLVHAPQLGRVSELLDNLPVIRGMSLRFMLPTEGGDNYASLRILSSLGVPSGFLLRGATADWERLFDLAHYFYFNFAVHASIAPFDSFGDQYAPGEGAVLGAAFFDHPGATYFHVNAEGQVAHSREQLDNGVYLPYPLDRLLGNESDSSVMDTLDQWSTMFALPSHCTMCPALKLCRGRALRSDGSAPDGCTGFFSRLTDLIEEFQAAKGVNKG